MNKYVPLLLLSVLTASCRESWNEASSKTFNRACIDERKAWAGSPENAVTYCNCVIAKVKEKYPDEDEAMKQVGSLVNDNDLETCKDSIMKKTAIK